MKKLILSTSVALALGLTGCGGGESIEDINSSTDEVTPYSRILFDPANGNLNVPNDLLMLPGDDGFFDYTLNIPVDDPTDFGDPQAALNILDGWSIQHPFTISVQTAPEKRLTPLRFQQVFTCMKQYLVWIKAIRIALARLSLLQGVS